jgi:hypothetical protein
MTSRSTWKRLERETARKLGGVRIPISGRSGTDVLHNKFEIECKLRSKIGFKRWFDKLKKNASRNNKIPLLILKEKHMKGEFVVLTMEDFQKCIAGYIVG